ncbi:MAG: serine hydrolase domain-containing protein [Planctomycetota bacterium]
MAIARIQTYLLKIIPCLLAISIAAVSSERCFAQQDFEHEAGIKKLVQPYLDANKFSAASLGISYKGKQYFLNFGKLDGQSTDAPTANTIYEIGSISKVFTGILLADAVEQKQLKLSDTLGSLVEGLNESNPDVGAITLQQLSNHVSGLPRMPNNMRPSDLNNPYADYDRDKMLSFLKSIDDLKTKPGEKHLYSNYGVGLLGDLISTKLNQPYDEVLQSRLTGPLKMSDTFIDVPGDQLQRFAEPHYNSGAKSYRWSFQSMAGAGGIRSTTRDMVRFIDANLKPPSQPVGKAIELAYSKHLDPAPEHRGMGLGWMIAGDGDTRFHGGQTGGYRSMMLVSRRHNIGVVWLCDTAGSETHILAENIIQLMMGMNVKPKSFESEFQADEKVVKRLAGKYQLFPQTVIEVFANGNQLSVQLTKQSTMPVFAESNLVWNYKAVKAQLVFELPEDENKPATQVTLKQNGRVMPAKRIED